jgi:hypothetical protein
VLPLDDEGSVDKDEDDGITDDDDVHPFPFDDDEAGSFMGPFVELSLQPIPTTTTATSSDFVNLFIYILLALIANSTNVEILNHLFLKPLFKNHCITG